MNSKPRERFVKSIEEGVAGTSMPPWAKVLKPEQADRRSGLRPHDVRRTGRRTARPRARCRTAIRLR